MKPALALGLGCDRGTPHATVAEVIDQALFMLDASWADVKAIASIDLKADEVALHELMQQRRMPIRFFSAAQLATVPVPNPSETVRKYTGTPSVSEAAALMVAGQGLHGGEGGLQDPAPMTDLLIEKLKLRGPDGRNATVSVARMHS